jgi:hypothetical protein
MKKFTKNQLRFIELIANTQYAKTDLEMAMELNVKPETLKTWRTLPGFRARVNQELEANFQKEWPNVMKQLVKKAKKGNMEAVKLYISQVTKHGKDDKDIDISGLNVDERAALVKDIEGRIKQIKSSGGKN